MRLSCFTYTNKGGRPDNEDSVRWDCQDGRGIFVLADGLGGHRSGEMASAIAAETILTGISEASALDEQLLAEQLEAANLQVMEGQKHPGCEDMKTTAVVLAADCVLSWQVLRQGKDPELLSFRNLLAFTDGPPARTEHPDRQSGGSSH